MLTRRASWVLAGAAVLLLLLLALGAVAFVWLGPGSSRTIGVIEGNVVEVDGEQVVIAAQREAQVGDPVTIYFAIPGLDVLGTVGSGTVVADAGGRVTANIERRTGDLMVGQIAKIGEIPGPMPAPPGVAFEETAAAATVPSPTPAPVTASDPGSPPGYPPIPGGTAALPPLYPPPARGSAGLPLAHPPPGDGTMGSFVGCFADTSTFDLDGHLERSAANTPQRCIAKCRELGFRYAGVQYGESCLCGNSYGRYGRAENCDYACTGDPGQVCGGYSANSVYASGGSGSELHLPPPPPPAPGDGG